MTNKKIKKLVWINSFRIDSFMAGIGLPGQVTSGTEFVSERGIVEYIWELRPQEGIALPPRDLERADFERAVQWHFGRGARIDGRNGMVVFTIPIIDGVVEQ